MAARMLRAVVPANPCSASARTAAFMTRSRVSVRAAVSGTRT